MWAHRSFLNKTHIYITCIYIKMKKSKTDQTVRERKEWFRRETSTSQLKWEKVCNLDGAQMW